MSSIGKVEPDSRAAVLLSSGQLPSGYHYTQQWPFTFFGYAALCQVQLYKINPLWCWVGGSPFKPIQLNETMLQLPCSCGLVQRAKQSSAVPAYAQCKSQSAIVYITEHVSCHTVNGQIMSILVVLGHILMDLSPNHMPMSVQYAAKMCPSTEGYFRYI